MKIGGLPTAQFFIDAGRRGGGNLCQSVRADFQYFRPSTPTPQPYKPVPRLRWHGLLRGHSRSGLQAGVVLCVRRVSAMDN